MLARVLSNKNMMTRYIVTLMMTIRDTGRIQERHPTVCSQNLVTVVLVCFSGERVC